MNFLFEVIVHTMCSVLVDVLCIYSIAVISILVYSQTLVPLGLRVWPLNQCNVSHGF